MRRTGSCVLGPSTALLLASLCCWIGASGCFAGGDSPLDPHGSDASTPGADAGTALGAGLPCGVRDVLAANCITCHTDPPVVGAPMPLLSWDDVQAPARSDASMRVWEMMKIRINDAARPMPPVGTLSDADKATLNAWLDAGAPMNDDPACGGGSIDAGVPTGPVGPEHLPCTPTHTFKAHAAGSADAPFHVPADAGNLYQCFTFRSDFTAGEQGIAFAPIIADPRVVHHWILYRTPTTQTDGGVGPCNMPGDATFVAGWAPGGGNFVPPDDIGLEMPGPDDWLILQLHYYNIAGYTDADDASGVAFCTTDTPRANLAGYYTVGDITLNIPAHSTDHVETGTCPSWATGILPRPVHIIGSFPHMHQLGTRFETIVYRGGDTARPDPLVQVDRWDFNNQIFYPRAEPMDINPGDEIVTRCTYSNPTGVDVHFGERTEDEMCLNFVLLYPIELFTGRRFCGTL